MPGPRLRSSTTRVVETLTTWPRRLKGKHPGLRLLLILLATAAMLVIFAVPPAFADSVNLSVSSWQYNDPLTYYYPVNGHYWYYFIGLIADQDPNTSGTQISIVAAKPVVWIQYWGSYSGYLPGAWSPARTLYYEGGAAIPASPFPQLVTVYPWIDSVVASVEGWTTEAAKNFADGYFQFTYSDGTSAIVPSNGTGSGPTAPQAGVFGLYPWSNHTKDPVNTSSGNATYSLTDLSLPGKGLPLTFTRTYNSQDGGSWGFLGNGWRCEYQTALDFPSTTEVTLVATDGREETFTASSGGDYDSPAGVTDRLHENTDGSFTLTALDQSQEEFDSGGQLLSMIDRYGNATTLTYTTAYEATAGGYITRLSGVTGAGGRSLTFTYSYGYLTQVEDSASRTVSYTYDTSGDLTGVTDPNGHTTTYTYDANHQLTSVSEPKASTNPFITNTYTDGQVTAQTDALGNVTGLSYDTQNQDTSITDARSHTSTDTWNENFWLTGQTDPLNHSSSITYNSQGLPETVTDANSHETTYGYDSLGNVTSVTDPESNETTADYDTSNGNLLWSKDASNHQTTYAWDSTGKFLNSIETPVGTTSFTYNTDGSVATSTDANSHTWSYSYDSAGDATGATDPLSKETTYGYDSAGRKTSITDANGSEVQFVYDAKGNVTSVKDPLAVTDSSNRHQINATYDANDNVTQLEDADGNDTSFTYDTMNHLTGVTDALSGTAAYTYDGDYNLTSAQDPNGHTTTYSYDADNRLTQIEDALTGC